VKASELCPVAIPRAVVGLRAGMGGGQVIQRQSPAFADVQRGARDGSTFICEATIHYWATQRCGDAPNSRRNITVNAQGVLYPRSRGQLSSRRA